jgi:S-(hydroxymethyl)mycothiol dehydrogenase
VAPGDFVVLNWRAVCGTCRSCLRGRPQYCFSTFNATQKMTLADGTPLSPALGIGAFVSETISLDDVEDAFHKMERGEVLRSVVVL